MVAMAQSRTASPRRLHVVYGGRVHGVGFRYTAESVALPLKLSGWVRNLPDGRVEVVCEGPEARLKRFIDEMRAGPMQTYIREAQVRWEAATGEFDDFHVRFT